MDIHSHTHFSFSYLRVLKSWTFIITEMHDCHMSGKSQCPDLQSCMVVTFREITTKLNELNLQEGLHEIENGSHAMEVISIHYMVSSTTFGLMRAVRAQRDV